MATPSRKTSLNAKQLENQHDHTVREEIETFRAQGNAFLAGEITDDEFRPFRLKHGIYGQRQPGVQMVRSKIPGGSADRAADGAAGAHRRRVRRRQGPPHHAPEHPVSLRAAGARARPDAPAGRRRPDQSRSLLQHRPQRDRLPAGRPRARRSLRRAPLRAEGRLRVSAQGPHRQPAAQIQDSLSTAAPTRIASRARSTMSACAP